MDDTYVDLPTACIDDVPDSPYGGIDLPPDEFYQVHDLPLGHHPKLLGLPILLGGMMVLSSCLLKSIGY